MRKQSVLISALILFSQASFAEKVPHPLAGKGLKRIEADGTYIYKTPTTPRTQGYNFKIGSSPVYNITSKSGTFTFADMYGGAPLFMMSLDYEWYPFSQFGKLGIVAGFGITSAIGQGRFENSVTTEANESYSFYGIPLNVGLVYRMQYANRQWIAPYFSGGGTYYGMIEVRDDNEINTAAAPGYFAAGGLLFNVSAMDRETGISLESEYGIGNLWLTAEYRIANSLRSDLDFSSDIISAGFMLDF